MQQSVSQFVRKFSEKKATGKTTFGDFVEELGSHSFALIIFILSLPMAGPWPMPPGMSAISGLPVLFLAVQMVLGLDAVWLPFGLRDKKFATSKIRNFLRRFLKPLEWMEKLLRPRAQFMFTPVALRGIGLLIAIMALVMALPVPGANFIPGLVICLLSLAILERDGILAIASVVFGILSLIFMYQLLGAAIETVADWLAL